MRLIPIGTLAGLVALAACAPDQITRSADDADARRVIVPACVEFGPPPALLTGWGAPVGTPPGTVLFVESGIPVSIHRFLLGGVWYYGGVRIENPPAPGVGVGQTARLNNAGLGFDFTGVGFPVSYVTFEWLDWGGDENLQVNGSGIYVGEFETAPAVLGGQPLTPAVAFSWVINQERGTMQIGPSPVGAPVNWVRIGGQELWIDRVCAHP